MVATAVGAIALLAVFAAGAPLAPLVLTIAVLLAVFGATDAADGFISVSTRSSIRHGVLETGSAARRQGWGSIALGTATCLLAAAGFIIGQSH